MDDEDADEDENADADKDKNNGGEEEHPRVVTDKGFPITQGPYCSGVHANCVD